jgi:hypothetical protein
MALVSHYNQVWSTLSPTAFEDLLVSMKHTLQSHEISELCPKKSHQNLNNINIV